MTDKKTKQELRDQRQDRPTGSQYSASRKPEDSAAPTPKKAKGGDK